MLALLAYKRPNADGQGTDYGFEIRQMTCFNGLNVQNAFRTVTPITSTSLDLIIPQGLLRHAVTSDPSGVTQAPWQFMALGWAADQVTSKNTLDDFMTQMIHIQGMEWSGQVLNREHVTGKYYDWNLSSFTTGKRDRTPLEVELGNKLCEWEQTVTQGWPQAVLESSKIAYMLFGNNRFQYALYDFVGAERPSGLAVAYLQVYRNFARNILSASAPSAKRARDTTSLLFKLDQTSLRHTNNIKSYIPIISAMNHNGTDSDILSFVGGSSLALQIMKFGTFSIDKFMFNKTAMPVEGLYKKGAQTDSLHANIERALRNQGRLHPSFEISRLSRMATSLASFAQYCDVSRIADIGIDVYLRNIAQQGERLRTAIPDLNALRNDLPRVLSDFVDLRTQPSEVRIAGAASGFLQWAEQTATQQQ